MLIVLPSGIEKEEIAFVEPSLRAAFRLAGRAAADEQVVKATSHGSKMPLRKVMIGMPVAMRTSGSRIIPTNTTVARKAVRMRAPSGSRTARP